MDQSLEKQISIIKRGTVDIIPEEELVEKIKKAIKNNKPLKVKLGLDPSAPDIHLGHTVVLQKMKQFQDLGHDIYVIIGDFTGRIGDPSGKSSTRKQMTQEDIFINSETYKAQIFKILDPDKTKLVFNSEWLALFSFEDVIRLAEKATVARILERDDFQDRYKNNKPIGIHEFFYPLMQGYDSVALEADIELGGTDQKFNLLMGRQIQKEYDLPGQIAITMPILEGLDGVQKMSKSLGNYVGINEAYHEMFGKLMSIKDEFILRYFELVTQTSMDKINQMKEAMNNGINPRNYKIALAKEIITTYHSKEAADELTDAEATLLAGLPQSPSFYDPYINMNEALKRRDIVIKRLVKTNKITEAEGEAIKNTKVVLTDKANYSLEDTKTKKNKYFTDYVTIQAERILSEKKLENLYKGGYTIYTTMDANIQQSIEDVYKNNSYFPKEMNGVKPESAMIVIDHTTGEIRGLVGGRTYEVEQGFNRAIDAKRQPGSTFKPISVYGPAFEAGIVSPSSIYNDSPEPPIYDGQGRSYELINYEGTYSGKMSIRKAIAYSTNTIAVRVLNDIGAKTGFEFAKRLGITSLENSEKDNLSLALGGLQQGVSPLEIARAYSAFANKGNLIENTSIRKIIDSYGNVVYEAKPKNQQVISQEVAYMITNTLEDVVNYGSGKSAALTNRDAAGKTGSTDMIDSSGKVIQDGNKDLWFVGYTPELTAAIWIGYDQSDENHYLCKNFSSNLCANIWRNVISQSLANTPSSTFEKPKNIIKKNINKTTGLPTNTNTGYTDIFIKGLEPKKISPSLFTSNINKGSAIMKNGEIILEWKGPETIYTIYRKTNTGRKEQLGETNSTNFIDSSVPKSRPIEYIVSSPECELTIIYK